MNVIRVYEFRRGDSVSRYLMAPTPSGQIGASPTHDVKFTARSGANNENAIFTFSTVAADSDSGLTITPLSELNSWEEDGCITGCENWLVANFLVQASAAATALWTPGEYTADVEVSDGTNVITHPRHGTYLVRILGDVSR